MNPERFRQIEELYHSALEQEPDDRSAFLIAACRGDDDLRRKVESLLSQSGSTDGLIDQAAWEAAAKAVDTAAILPPGARLGPYQILGLLDAGGMGTVYHGLDTRLNRAVAIKISAAQFSARFEREARAISALNHPNICTLYDVGPDYLVMELMEGRTLASHLKKGPLPVELVLRYGGEIAGALAAAHARGIVHRDLKPANIMVTKSGIKILDFGLAKTQTPGEALSETNAVMGTPAYMAPEQHESNEADARSDIYSFGLVLYEMATGKRAVHSDLQPLPPPLDYVVKTCLAKDPDDRWQSARDIKLAIGQSSSFVPLGRPGGRPYLVATATVAAVVCAAALAFVHFREKPQEEKVMRLSIPVPENTVIRDLTLSPDGRRLVASVFVGVEGKTRLVVRSLDSPQFQPLPGTDRALTPFWSPDSRFIGFIAEGKLKTIPASGGPAQALCDAGLLANGGSWNRDGVILFGTNGPGPILRVNAAGGPCTPVTKAEPDTRHGGPEFLPDGKHFFYVVQAPEQAKSGIYLAALDDPTGRRLLADQSSVIYTPPAPGSRVSHLLFLREDTLMAQPFDAGALHLAGDPFPVVAQASSIETPMLFPTASASCNGVLVYLANHSLDRQLAWFDRSGSELGKVAARGRRRGVALSPDGKAASSSLPDGVWLLDLPRGVETHVTQATQLFSGVVWSPDGSRIVFTKNQDLYSKDLSGKGVEEPLLRNGHVKSASDWSRDGRFLLYTEQDPKTRSDIWYLPDPLKPGSKQPVKFLATEFNEGEPQFSPDGKWVAYFSSESGNDVYVRPFPSGAGQWRVSTNTGRDPRWSRDGKELFYLEYSGPLARVMAVAVRLGPGGTPEFGAPRKLFEYRAFSLGFTPLSNSFAYSPSPDGQHFLVNMDADTAEPVINVITNWQKAAVAAGKEQ